MYQVQITKPAKQDLDEAAKYIRNVFQNQSAAQHMLGEAYKQLHSLSDFPNRNPLVRNPILAANGIRLQRIGNYLAAYVVREDTGKVIVLRILYKGRDWISILKSEI